MKIKYPNTEIRKKKKSSALPWVLALGAIGGLWYWNKKKKEKERVALAAQTQVAQFKAPQQTRTTPARPSLPGSAESRLRAMGEHFKGSNPSARQEWREV